jgi:hypothetical protein
VVDIVWLSLSQGKKKKKKKKGKIAGEIQPTFNGN